MRKLTLVLAALGLIALATPSLAVDAKEVNKVPHCTVQNLAICAVGEDAGRMGWVVDGVDPFDCSVGGADPSSAYQHVCLRNQNGTWYALPSSADLDFPSRLGYLSAGDFGLVSDASPSSCDDNSPQYCTAIGSGTDNSTFLETAMAAASALDVGLQVPPGHYRISEVLQNETDLTVYCPDGVFFYPAIADTDGGWMWKMCSGESCPDDVGIAGSKLIGCNFINDYTELFGVQYSIATGTISGTPGGGMSAPYFENFGNGYVSMETSAAHTLDDNEFIYITGVGTASPYVGYHQILTTGATTVYFKATWTADDPDTNDTWMQVPGPNETVNLTGGTGTVVRWDNDHGIIRLKAGGGATIGTSITKTDGWTLGSVATTCLQCQATADSDTMGAIKVGRVSGVKLADVMVSGFAKGISIDSGSSGNPADEIDMENVDIVNTPRIPANPGYALDVGETTDLRTFDVVATGGVHEGDTTDFSNALLRVTEAADRLTFNDSVFYDSDAANEEYLDTPVAVYLGNTSADIGSISFDGGYIGAAVRAALVVSNIHNVTSLEMSNTDVKSGILSFSAGTGSDLTWEGGDVDCNESNVGAAFSQVKGRRISVSDIRAKNCPVGLFRGAFLSSANGEYVQIDHFVIVDSGSQIANNQAMIRAMGSATDGLLKFFRVSNGYIEHDDSDNAVYSIMCRLHPRSEVSNVIVVNAQSPAGFFDCHSMTDFYIDGAEADGIYTSDMTGIVISGGKIKDAVDDGIEANNTLASQIHGVVIDTAGGNAIVLTGTSTGTRCSDIMSIDDTSAAVVDCTTAGGVEDNVAEITY